MNIKDIKSIIMKKPVFIGISVGVVVLITVVLGIVLSTPVNNDDNNSNHIRCSSCGEDNLENSRFCSSCGAVIKSNETNEDPQNPECQHLYMLEITTEATCAKDGVKTFTCSKCNDTYTEKIKATGKHNYTSKITTEATCAKDGVKTFTCSKCNDTYTVKIKATGKHNYTSKITTEATCTEDGVKTFTCSVCKGSYTQSIAAGHQWIDATCTAPRTCSRCKITEGEVLGHSYSYATDNVSQICGRCGNTITWYSQGMYQVGVDIPAGEYYLSRNSSIWAYFGIYEDRFGDNILENGTVYQHYIVTLENGQYFEISGVKCTNIDNIKRNIDSAEIREGVYRVGIDIPAGEYRIEPSIVSLVAGSAGKFSVCNSSNVTRGIRRSGKLEYYDDFIYVTVYSGEYLYIEDSIAMLIQEMNG